MKEKLKKVYYWTIELVGTMVSLISILLFSSYKVAYGVEKLKKERKREAFVLANGPSLKNVLLNKKRLAEILRGDVIVMNNFANNELFWDLKPKYYILLDPLFYDERAVAMNVQFRMLYDSLHKVDWDMTLFLVKGANVTTVTKKIDNEKIKNVLFNGTKIVGYNRFQNFGYKYHLGVPSSRNVVIPALLLMIGLGYKNIYLYGAEFSWTKNIDVNPVNNGIYLNDSHFYKKDDVKYYESGWYKCFLESVVDMMNGIEQIAKYANSRGVKIINRTKGSFIDSFEYENIDNIVG